MICVKCQKLNATSSIIDMKKSMIQGVENLKSCCGALGLTTESHESVGTTLFFAIIN